ncbi:MAG: hypothetical protein LBC97_13170 [Bifidobacteriaceae bacterium]|jgi:hypothetical protein|nr:hypothetical protein [Bifidobacteriaceae bacterium]
MTHKSIRPLAVAVAVATACLAAAGCGSQAADDQTPVEEQTTPAKTPQASPSEASPEEPELTASPSGETTLDGLEVSWLHYTMAFSRVTDNPEQWNGTMGFTLVNDDVAMNIRFVDTSFPIQGKLLRVVFDYRGGSKVGDAFDFRLKDLRDAVKKDPIRLIDGAGNTYDVVIVGSGPAYQSDAQERLYFGFDVPADSKIEDFRIDTGSGDQVTLAPLFPTQAP